MLTEEEKRILARLEEQMATPKWKFVFTYGVLAWGIGTALLVTLINMLFFKKSLQATLNRDLWANLVTFMIGGIFFGLIIWKLTPRQIKKLKDKELSS